MNCPYYKSGENIRPEILFFAKQMEKVMKRHDAVKGDSWKCMSDKELLDKLEEEYHEAEGGIFAKEYLDVGLVCMMLFWNGCKRSNWNLPEDNKNKEKIILHGVELTKEDIDELSKIFRNR